MRFVSGWRLALRVAWREAWRSKARSVLVLVMVTFPVVAVIAADVAQATSSVSSVEGLGRRIGSAQAEITALPNSKDVAQIADPNNGGFSAHPARHRPPPSLDAVKRALGGERPATELRQGQPGVRTDLGVLRADALGVDLASPLSKGLVRLTSGRLPRTAHEVAINAALAGHGFGVGDRMTLTDGTTATVVGTAESAGERTSPFLVALPDFFPPVPDDSIHEWLVGGSPVTWDQVRAVNRVGGVVTSREVIEHPPSADQLPPGLRDAYSTDHSTIYTVLVLVGVMALIEVVLLAGPAFAVGARRQSRSLALIAANGGTPTQSRRVILGAAVVIGTVSAVIGIGLGIAVGRVLVPILQARADSYFGPFQVRWPHVLGIAAFGLVSAFLAAVVPAWIASRQDVVAVLAGRRGDRAASRRSPVIGVLLAGAGVFVAVLGSRRDSGETLIAGAAVLTVLGMIFLVPVVVVTVAQLGRRLPLPLRYAVRDAARHRTRTVPAVAAVAATVAGTVALSIGNTSDQAQAKAEYVPEFSQGTGATLDYAHRASFVPAAVDVLRKAGAEPTVVDGVSLTPSRHSPYVQLGRAAEQLPLAASDILGADTLVADRLPPVLPDAIDSQERAAADAALARGGVVLFSSTPVSLDETVIRSQVDTRRRSRTLHRVSVPAYVVDTGRAYGPASMVLSRSAARRLAVPVVPAAAMFDADRLTPETLDAVEQGIQALSPQGASIYIERGYQETSSEKVVLWILFGLAAVLMLGGTLTATFLALSDARPDLATLSAVGASPRMRRAVAAAYAVSVGVVGAVLGAAVGFVPGIAVSYPLTRPYNSTDPGPSHYLSIPWLEIVGLVALLPVLTAVVVGLLARSRLPLVARLD
jgi:putative ABC transport system permease protein